MAGISLKRPTLTPGTLVLTRYTVLELIHSKGMANVYLVQDTILHKQWVLKEVVKEAAGRDDVEYESILREAQIISRLNHPGIPRIVELTENADAAYIVMDYVDGSSIQTILGKDGPIPEDLAVNWMTQTANILGYLHSLDTPVFYRDLKPGNIMVQSNNQAKLLDFGISEVITEENAIIQQPLGTRGFAPPEQGKVGQPYDLRSDIYAFGVTMFVTLTGIHPSKWKKGTPYDLHMVEQAFSKGLRNIILVCTNVNPDARYQTIEELQYALNNYQRDDNKFYGTLRRKRNTVIGLFAIGVLLLGGSFGINQYNKAQDASLYEREVTAAQQTGRFEDYINAISLNPTKAAPYLEAIQATKEDGVFTPEEEQALLNLINPNLDALRNDPDWGDVAFEMGKNYWFFYEGNENGKVLSIKWFQDAIDNDATDKSQAAIFYQMGTFQRDIASSVQEGSDAGKYAEYWGNLVSVKDKAEAEVNQLQTRLMIAQTISQYSYRLRTDGVPESSVMAEVEELQNFVDTYRATPGVPEEIFAKLKEIVPTLNAKVAAGYSEVN